MKRLFLTTLLTVLALAAGQAQTTNAPAEPPAAPAPPPGAPPAPEKMADHRLMELCKKLNLTDAQKEQIKPILLESAQKMKALHEDASLDKSAKMAQFKTIREDEKTKLAAILTPDQLAQIKEHHDGPPPAPAPAAQ